MLDLVDRIIVLDNGKVIGDGPRDRVLAELAKRAKAAEAGAAQAQAAGAATSRTTVEKASVEKPSPAIQKPANAGE